ncbi:hypothetical protein DUNSADRAFT_4620 [Dunaliella salina]|uniref:F-box domain-containing protein n=1 Tax=Dunaliella salina TaxID=3046 RepID=A0ABQ7GRL8_DUNSA|nr:hypothetical protein DUNSADRAFT_4620 [Dunaliella salina]|eukprot:KAF5837229.1 hypothetical protein DUNSADRAFT_4620 [Dunaliella salina]
MEEHVTCLQDLPQEIFGLIYGRLRSNADRMHFFHSCREVHDADSVLRQIYRLELKDQDVTQLSRFPSKATLRVLKINKRTNMPVIPWTREVQPCGDLQGPPLKLLWDYIASANLSLDSVQEIHLHGYNLQESCECAPLALHCPRLSTLTLSNIRVKEAELFKELTGGCRHLHTVDAIASDYTSLEAIVTGLAALQDRLKVLRIAGTNNALRLRPLQCLEVLEELDLTYQNDTVLWLDVVLEHCHKLKVRDFSSR